MLTRFLLFSALGSCILAFTAPAAFAGEVAPPKVVSFTAEPTRFEPAKLTLVTFTVVLEAKPLTEFTPRLESLKTDGNWEDVEEVKLALVPKSSNRAFKFHRRFKEPDTRRIRLRLVLSSPGTPPAVSPIVTLSVGKIVHPSKTDDSTVGPPDPDSTIPRMKVTIPGGALRSPAYVGIAPAYRGLIGNPKVGLTRAETFDLIFDPVSPLDAQVLTLPLIISVPARGEKPGPHFYFVQQVLADNASGGLTSQFLTMDEGSVVGKEIVTDATQPVLQGFFSGGIVAVLEVPGSGYVLGKVTDSAGVSRHGVWVRNAVDYPDPGASNVQGFFTDVNGLFVVPVNGSKYRIEAIDGFRCGKGNAPPKEALLRKGQIKDIGTLVVSVNTASSPTRDGIRNAGFEVGAPTFCWTNLTQERLIARGSRTFEDLLGFQTPIEPSEGTWMAALTQNNPSLEQTFLMPALFPDVPRMLYFDYHFGCRPTDSCPAPKNSTIRLQAELLNASTGASLAFTSVPFLPVGSNPAWRTAELDVSRIEASTRVTLRLTADNFDARTQPVALVDNIRFGTVHVTANLLVGTSTTGAQVEQQIRDANEILSQAGVNVLIRTINNPVDPSDATCNGSGFDFFGTDPESVIIGTDVTWDTKELPNAGDRNAGVRTKEMRALTCFGPKNAPTAPIKAVHTYYVNNLGYYYPGLVSGVLVYGVAVTGEDYHSEIPPDWLNYNALDILDGDPTRNVFNDSAILLGSLAGTSSDPNRQKETPAHELGHLLMPSKVAESDVEHATGPGNIMTGYVCTPSYSTTRCSARPILDRGQSALFELPR